MDMLNQSFNVTLDLAVVNIVEGGIDMVDTTIFIYPIKPM